MTAKVSIKANEPTLISRQIKVLNKNGIYPIESKPKMNMIIVNRNDLDRATALKISNEITIARRW